MKNLIILFILIALAVCASSCSGDELASPEQTRIEQADFLLLGGILVQRSQEEGFRFMESQTNVQRFLSDLFCKNNDILRSVDDFGFVEDPDLLGQYYLFVKSKEGDRSKTVFVPVDEDVLISSRSNDEQAGQRIIGGGACESENCCETCVFTRGSCKCNKIDAGCMSQGETNISCIHNAISIVF